MAIEHANIQSNDSIIADEILAHRLGLIPINADARHFDEFTGERLDNNCLVFHLKVTSDSDNFSVYSSRIKWIPFGNQAEHHKDLAPSHGDIVLCKLNTGQTLDIELVAIKGKGKDHAKWSPVCKS
jgi:DNA-directed RNA polymerases I and III subunit RPAC1